MNDDKIILKKITSLLMQLEIKDQEFNKKTTSINLLDYSAKPDLS